MITRIKVGTEIVSSDDTITSSLNVENPLSGNLLLFPLGDRVRGDPKSAGEFGLAAEMSLDALEDAGVSNVTHMNGYINRQLSRVNPHLIDSAVGAGQHKRMVDTPRPEHYTSFKDWLEATRKSRGLTKASIAQIAGRTPQAATKWFQGGDVEPESLRKIADWAGVPYEHLRLMLDGQPIEGRKKAVTPILSPIAQRISRKAEMLDETSITAVETLIDTFLATSAKQQNKRKSQ